MSTTTAAHHDEHHDHPTGMMRWFTTTNHKDIGTMYLTFALIMFMVGGSMIMAVRAELFHRLAAKNFAERQATAEGERQRMADWIAAYHRVAQRSQPPRTPPPTRPGF